MITAQNLTKTFDKFTALENLNCSIPNGCIYGMVGSNGAGKSTLLRLITGIYRPDKGEVLIDGKRVYDNPEVKRRFVFVPDELYFLPQATMNRMAGLYKAVYPSFDDQRFKQLSQAFNLAPNVKLQTFSKGMKRQAATILALSAKPEFIFFDETFDGLDPVMRNLVKKVIYADVCERKATAVITSHSLRELEDTCDQLALLQELGGQCHAFRRDGQNLCFHSFIFLLLYCFASVFLPGLPKSAARPRGPGRRPAHPANYAASGRCGDRSRGPAGSCRCVSFRCGHRCRPGSGGGRVFLVVGVLLLLQKTAAQDL